MTKFSVFPIIRLLDSSSFTITHIGQMPFSLSGFFINFASASITGGTVGKLTICKWGCSISAPASTPWFMYTATYETCFCEYNQRDLSCTVVRIFVHCSLPISDTSIVCF